MRGIGVADVVDDLARELRNVDVGGGGDLARHDADPGGDQHFAGYAAGGVLRQDRVENRIGDLVRHLVGMTLGDGFGRENVANIGQNELASWLAGGLVSGQSGVGPTVRDRSKTQSSV